MRTKGKIGSGSVEPRKYLHLVDVGSSDNLQALVSKTLKREAGLVEAGATATTGGLPPDPGNLAQRMEKGGDNRGTLKDIQPTQRCVH